MKSKTIVIRGVEDVILETNELNTAQLGHDDYLIETEVSLISAGTELSRVFGIKKEASYPVYPGYCAVGKVLKCGNPDSLVQEGDRVLFGGIHADYQIFNPNKRKGSLFYKLKEETKSVDAAYIAMCWIAMNGILPADVKLSDTAAVVGMGTLGLICAIYYRQMGIDVTAIEPVASRAAIARKLDIPVIDCSVESQLEEVMKMTEKRGFDIVVDATGMSSAIENCIKMAAMHGQVVLMGSPRSDYIGNMTDVFSAIHMKMLTVIGALNLRYPYSKEFGSRLYKEKSLRQIEKMLNQKVIDTDYFVSHVIEADESQIMDAYRGLMYDKETYTGVIIDWKKGE